MSAAEAKRIDRRRSHVGDACGVNGTEIFACRPWRCELRRALDHADAWEARAHYLEGEVARLTVALRLAREYARLHQTIIGCYTDPKLGPALVAIDSGG